MLAAVADQPRIVITARGSAPCEFAHGWFVAGQCLAMCWWSA